MGAAVRDASRRRQGLRRPDRRPVLRRPRLGLRPRRAAAVQPRPRDPAAGGARRRRRRRLQHAHDRAPGADRAADQGQGRADGAERPRRRARDLRDREPPARPACSTRTATAARTGDFVQVSRLANPLVNEVVIPLGREGPLERVRPVGRRAVRRRVPEPEVTRLENGALPRARRRARDESRRPRRDPAHGCRPAGCRRADQPQLHRLDEGRPDPAEHGHRADRLRPAPGNRLGVLAGDFAGFPNGRRLEDDVTDIELRAFACGYGTVVGPVVEALGECGGNAQPDAEQPARRRRRRERPAVPRQLPVRGRAASGLRARPPQQRRWAVARGRRSCGGRRARPPHDPSTSRLT